MEEEYLKKQRIYKTIMLVALTAFITFIITTVYISNRFNLSTNNKAISSILGSSKDDDLTTSLKNIESIVDRYYLNEVDKEAAIEGAISGYVSALGDEYTEYIKAEDMKEYTEQIMGNYVGIGIYMTVNRDTNSVMVLSPIKESPAEKAGLLPGDIIKSVDGVEYTGDEMTAAANSIKGEEGTKVTLEILRGEESKTVEITREKVNTNPVVSKKLDNNIGYIEVSSFDEGTAEDFKTKFEELKKQNIESLIIDLRNNGGGLVDEALKMADYIVPKGEKLLITVNKNEKEDIEIAKEDPIIDMPIVVLVNEHTASASEILSGALKDHKEATIVGTKTYGKGVIQQLLTMKTGAGLKITIEEYYTPNKTKINKVGIEPDEVVELPDSITNVLAIDESEDTQLQKAIEILK